MVESLWTKANKYEGENHNIGTMPASVINKHKKMKVNSKKQKDTPEVYINKRKKDKVYRPKEDYSDEKQQDEMDNQELLDENIKLTEDLKEKNEQLDEFKEYMIKTVWDQVKDIVEDDERNEA